MGDGEQRKLGWLRKIMGHRQMRAPWHFRSEERGPGTTEDRWVNWQHAMGTVTF
jgi:hypothetical protein